MERQGRGSIGRPKKLSKEAEEDLLTEVQRLRAENDDLKSLQNLVLEDGSMPAQKTRVVLELKQRHCLDIIAQLPRATFYHHLKRINCLDNYETVKAEITAIHYKN